MAGPQACSVVGFISKDGKGRHLSATCRKHLRAAGALQGCPQMGVSQVVQTWVVQRAGGADAERQGELSGQRKGQDFRRQTRAWAGVSG